MNKALKVYDFIVEFKRTHDGNSPTHRQIMSGVGLSSTSVVAYHIKQLIADGRLYKITTFICVRDGHWTIK